MFGKETKENAVEKTAKSADIKYKNKEAASLDKGYKLENYAERKARREAEINGLKKALYILESETAFVQTAYLRGVRKHM